MTNVLNEYESSYLAAVSAGQLEEAKGHLLRAIVAAKEINALAPLAGFAQSFGSVLLKQGDSTGAIAFHELSEALDPGSLLAKLGYAKFLLSEVGNKGAALAKCEEIISAATASPFPSTADDFSSQEYIDAALRVVQQIGAK